MPELTLSFPTYTREGIRLEWEVDHAISFNSGEASVLRANRAGFLTLARFAATLAQEGVPAGAHVHLDAFNGLEEGSDELILELVD